MDILVATFNLHKVQELVPLFPGHRLFSPLDLGYPEMEIEEDGSNYFENALIKAKVLYKLAGMTTLADDSGLSLEALGGGPGIHSSRYGSMDGHVKLSSGERNALLLAEMKGVEERACAFYCCLVLLHGADRFISVQETCPGVLAEVPRGSGGFGYDPLVCLPELGKTVAELSPEEKNIVSHRGRAARLMNSIIAAVMK
ncbi:MAG: non-canonical purine NTP pyrophosphatase [Spirochaetae bacterium HGW-Spirochaetae-9]|nr:MAG: non-canonical purine NTP pyrophosphatase [Spirochaetae bacterium HGW-Spirochaetae-9]